MDASKGNLALRIGLTTASAALLLVGASFNSGGRVGLPVALGGLTGLLALACGVMYRTWRVAVPLGALALVVTLVVAQFNPMQGDLVMQLLGLVLLGAGGVVGRLTFRHFGEALRRDREQLDALSAQLDQKQHAFLAATSDLDGAPAGDPASITARVAAPVGADFACCYLVSADGRRLVPQPPGLGVERLRPQAVNRPHGVQVGPLLSAIESRQSYAAPDENALAELMGFVPDDFHLSAVLAVPMPVAEHLGGFILLGRSVGAFSEDDRRLAAALAARAGSQVASSHLIALTRQESARYSLMNELVKEASGKTMNEVLDLVLGRGREVVRYDGGRALMFQPDGKYVVLDGEAASAAEPIDGPLARVREGDTMLRNLVTEDEGIYSGLHPDHLGGTINEALTPIRGKSGVVGALCLGRRGNVGFSQQDLGPLGDLGSMAGVAVENSRILQVVTGQATRLDTALDALGEVSAALTTVTQGSKVLEQKTLEAAIRIVDGTAGLLTRTNADGQQVAIMAVWLEPDPNGMVFQNGQGVVGATMLSGRTTVVSDLSWQAELASPPDLKGLKAAICTPMMEDGALWGTLSVFDDEKREWTPDDQRVLATLGNQGVVAVRNAELYEKNERAIWELRNLQEALQAATSTLDLNQVLQQVLAGAAKASAAQIGALALDDSGHLVLKAGFGTDHVTAERLALGVGGEICRRVMDTGQPVMEAIGHVSDGDSQLHPRAVLSVPITLRGKPLGVVFLANYKSGHAFTADHRDLVTELATQAAVAIDNARLFKDREEVILASLEALANAVDARDPYTAGHSQRVTQYALMIARQMHYAPKDQGAWVRLERGGRLHDIGKIGVPDAILQKTGKLTEQEFEKMKSHTVVGFNILSGLKMLTDELVIVRSHHERFDGKGYPDRKDGDELPMFAWIVSAADAIDAMTSDRPYRKGMSLEVAMQQMRAGAGTHFHPDVAEAVLDAVANGTLKVVPQQSMYKDAPAVGAFENPTA